MTPWQVVLERQGQGLHADTYEVAGAAASGRRPAAANGKANTNGKARARQTAREALDPSDTTRAECSGGVSAREEEAIREVEARSKLREQGIIREFEAKLSALEARFPAADFARVAGLGAQRRGARGQRGDVLNDGGAGLSSAGPAAARAPVPGSGGRV